MSQLSVIIPVYNAARFLDGCLASVCNQDFRDLEILCIDDGSSDGSERILAKWQKADARIRIFQQFNQGPSAARNVGLDNASGDWIAFLDADDTIAAEMYAVMMGCAQSSQLDAVGCTFMTFPDEKTKPFTFRTGEILNFGEMIATSDTVESSNDLCFVWRYLFRKQILESNGIRFREDLRLAEDMVFNTEVLAACHRILLLPDAYYHHRIDNPGSLMKQVRNPERLTSLPIMYQAKREQIRRFGMDRYSPCTHDLAEYTVRAMLPILFNALPEETYRKRVREILALDMIRESCREIGFRNPFDTFKEYLYYLSVKFRLAGIVSRLYFKV